MNPYLPPTAAENHPPAGGYGPPVHDALPQGGMGVSDVAIESMRQTKPWVVFLGVISLVGSAFMFLMGLLMMAVGSFAPKTGPVSPAILGVVYLPMAAIYIYPGIKLWKYGKAIGQLVNTRASSELEQALDHQKSFWKFCGILTVCIVGFYILVFLGALVAGVVAGGRH